MMQSTADARLRLVAFDHFTELPWGYLPGGWSLLFWLDIRLSPFAVGRL